MFDKLSKINVSELKKWNISPNEIAYLKNKILNDKLGLVLNFEEKDENLENYYFGLEEVKELHINPKEKNNHLLIEGDNYYALKALQISGIKVDVIYIDPPYNTGNKDFIYNDNYVNKDDQFKHSKWLSFMKKRLELAKELLADDGVIFVSIDDNEHAYLKVLMDEIFGEENFQNSIVWVSNRSGRQISNNLYTKTYEHILVYSKNFEHDNITFNRQYISELMPLLYKETDIKIFKDEFSTYILQYELHNQNIKKFNSLTRPNLFYPIYTNGNVISLENKENFIELLPPKQKNIQGVWRWGKEKVSKEIHNLIIINKNGKYKIFPKKRNIVFSAKDLVLSSKINTKTGSKEMKELGLNFDYPKPSILIKYLIKNFKNSAIILDFFSGSGTTAQAVMELNEEDGGNRRFILCTNNENDIAQKICRERIYRVINGEGSKKEEIDWNFSKDKKSLINNSMKYLKVKSIDKVNGDYEEINNLKEIYKNEFNKDLSIKDFK